MYNYITPKCGEHPCGEWIVTFSVCSWAFSYGQLVAWPASALIFLRTGTHEGLTLQEKEFEIVTMVFYVGQMTSPVIAGYVMDMIGRRNTIGISTLLLIAKWVLIGWTANVNAVYLARFIGGVWSGVVLTVQPVYAGECVSAKSRGKLISFVIVAIFAGAFAESIMNSWTYHILAYHSLAHAILLEFLNLTIPESFYFYMKKNDMVSAEKSMSWLRGKPVDRNELLAIKKKVDEQMKSPGRFIDLFRNASTRRAFIIMECCYTVQRACGFTLLNTFATDFLPEEPIGQRRSFMIISASWLIFAVFNSFVMDKFARRAILMFSCLGCTTTMWAVVIWYYIRDVIGLHLNGVFPTVILVVHGFFFTTGIVSIPMILTSELFPLNLKARASPLGVLTGSIVSVVITYSYYPIKYTIGVYFCLSIAAMAPMFCFFLALLYLVETKGESLERIQELLSEPPPIYKWIGRKSQAIRQSFVGKRPSKPVISKDLGGSTPPMMFPPKVDKHPDRRTRSPGSHSSGSDHSISPTQKYSNMV